MNSVLLALSIALSAIAIFSIVVTNNGYRKKYNEMLDANTKLLDDKQCDGLYEQYTTAIQELRKCEHAAEENHKKYVSKDEEVVKIGVLNFHIKSELAVLKLAYKELEYKNKALVEDNVKLNNMLDEMLE